MGIQYPSFLAWHARQVQDAHTVIGKGMFKKETDMSIFANLKVEFSTGMYGPLHHCPCT